jgi:hypothetical protein
MTILVMTAASPLLAQDEPRAWAHVFGGFGAITSSGDSEAVLHIGGGGEGLLAGGLGVTGELGYLSSFQDFSGGIGVFSVGAMYVFNRDRKTVPFVNGGYTLFFRSGTENGFFFGGGVNHWIGESWGIRIEGRDQVFACDTGVHTIEARFAIILK